MSPAVHNDELPASAYESDQLFRRLLRSHPGVVVDSQALLSAAPAVSRAGFPPLVRLLVRAREAGLPVLLRGAEHAQRVRSEYRRRGLQQLWTDVLAADEHRHTAAFPYVTAVLPDQVREFLAPVPGLLPTVGGRLIGPPQHPAPMPPHAQAMIVQLMAGRSYEQIASLAGCPVETVRNTANHATSPRGCRSVKHLIARDIVDGYLSPDPARQAVTGTPAALSPVQTELLTASIDQQVSAKDGLCGHTRRVAYSIRHAAAQALGARNPVHAIAVALAIGAIADEAVPARDPYPADGRRLRAGADPPP